MFINWTNGETKLNETTMQEFDTLIRQAIEAATAAPIGSGMDFYGETPPTGYMFADGSAISRTEYSDLFNVIGTTYGAGDGETTFNLPDKRERVSVMYKAGSTIGTENATMGTLGAKGGNDTQALTKANLPHINGSFTMHGAAISTNISAVSGDFTTTYNNSKYKNGGSEGTANSVGNVILDIGNNEAHNNLQPYLVCNYIIKVI